ncbi:MAG TPA: aminofutalosine synthase MqnE [Geobacteraceae bacterium]|nr:aminofutalosine synthase MqnE [Geobacteraceae bacterium]
MISIALISDKVNNGLRIDEEEALFLLESNDLLEIGEIAASVNERKNGRRVFFNINRHINYTNICVKRCNFCAFSRQSGEDGAYTLSLSEIESRAREARRQGATELHIVGGLHPELPFDYYLELLKTVKLAAPSIHVKAFTAVEIDHLAAISGLPTGEVLSVLREAGLGSMPGGGAEIFAPQVREELCPEKISGDRWLSIMEEAHSIGIRSNATMLFGHLESLADRVDHLRRLRELQDRTGGFQAFVPLAFQPENNRLRIAGVSGTTGFDDLRTLAVSRIYLDNFDNIKAYWVMLGEKTAQVALSFGVNDLDGTVIEEKIGHDAGAGSPQSLSRDEILRLIRKAGKRPVERDTLYNSLREY